jgi:hypothetical protein
MWTDKQTNKNLYTPTEGGAIKTNRCLPKVQHVVLLGKSISGVPTRFKKNDWKKTNFKDKQMPTQGATCW